MVNAALKRFIDRDSFDSAAVLSFATIFAIVPGLSLALSIFSLSPYFVDFQSHLEEFLFNQLIPQNHDLAIGYIQQFIFQAQSIKGLSSIFLIFAVLLLLYEIDKRINLVWHSNHRRHWMKGLASYLFVLFLGPILIGVSLFASSYVMALELFDVLSIDLYNSFIVPLLLSSFGFSIMYFVVPEEPVRFISATKAGIIAATLLEIIKHAMFFYIQYFNFYEVIYGTLSVLMMVIIWIYLAWVIVLFGANFCYCLEDK
ncbi:MAG TPA: hypothetical protein DCX64_06235 [Gammaproteobacteria bacterium]|nr:YihY family inner membrane protein [Gammaproteobacteria bacterium]HAY41860.1 hypothetical protein [Gammaproteobacteria bacterium]|tara:strand:+ start:989 stop:1759 length:771 start_codon:yes stop_codon:yes gene_type:complete